MNTGNTALQRENHESRTITLASDCNNLGQFFERQFELAARQTCHRFVFEGQWRETSWAEVRRQAAAISGGLHELGIKNQDRVSIFSATRQEWTLADLGILGAGSIVVPIYPSSTAEQASFILKNCGASAIFIDNEATYSKIKTISDGLPELKHIIFFTAPSSPVQNDHRVLSLEELMAKGNQNGEKIYQENLLNSKQNEIASIVYTSGTTGHPKGAMLTHGNFLHQMDSMQQSLRFEKEYEHLLFLPLAHIFARILQYSQLGYGFVQCYAESIDRLMDNIVQVRPHFLASVPRIFEKIYAATMQQIHSAPEAVQKNFEHALSVGKRRADLQRAGHVVPDVLEKEYQQVKGAFAKLQEKMGGRLIYFITGGAPIPEDIVTFLEAADFVMLEGYGLTETTAGGTVATFASRKLGTIGKTAPGVEIKIADDGEILIKGPHVFKGYYQNPEATREAIDAQAWFHSGDLGEMDAEGFVKITGRKKDLIITSGGKNIAPQNIESLMKDHPLISQFVVLGDRRKYLVALITLNQMEIENLAQKQGVAFKNYEELLKTDFVQALVSSHVNEKNKKLASYETIKKFTILPTDFSVPGGELTPTLKVRRQAIAQKYTAVADGLYQE